MNGKINEDCRTHYNQFHHPTQDGYGRAPKEAESQLRTPFLISEEEAELPPVETCDIVNGNGLASSVEIPVAALVLTDILTKIGTEGIKSVGRYSQRIDLFRTPVRGKQTIYLGCRASRYHIVSFYCLSPFRILFRTAAIPSKILPFHTSHPRPRNAPRACCSKQSHELVLTHSNSGESQLRRISFSWYRRQLAALRTKSQPKTGHLPPAQIRLFRRISVVSATIPANF